MPAVPDIPGWLTGVPFETACRGRACCLAHTHLFIMLQSRGQVTCQYCIVVSATEDKFCLRCSGVTVG